MYRILLVEDDAIISNKIREALSGWGFLVRCAEDLSDVMRTFEDFAPELVILDVALPYYNGYYWCGQIRKVSKAPVLFLSSHTESMDIVMAMQTGGDDYLTKPVDMDVLVAKVQALLRRAYDYEPERRLTIRGATLDVGALVLHAEGGTLPLTRNEARILQVLLANKGAVVSREKLMLALWNSDSFIDDNTLTVNVNRLRKSLEEAGLADCIVTHRNRGYGIRE